jgi:IS1 family transposase
MLVKLYDSKGNYYGAEKRRINGNPDMDHISTSYVERQNLTIRMVNRQFSRRTEAFSIRLTCPPQQYIRIRIREQ